jgi:hypothetical protein
MIDEQGNGYTKNGNIVYLHLADKKKRISLGKLNSDDKEIEIERDYNRHLLKKANSYGFNYGLLSKAKLFNKIRLTDDNGIYLIPVREALAIGKFLHFKQKGFERQIFLDYNWISNFKVKDLLF